MAYYVVDHSGQKYGPADVNLLNQWIAEGRLMPHMLLEDEWSGAQISASVLPGLDFAGSSNPHNHYSQQAYAQQPYAQQPHSQQPYSQQPYAGPIQSNYYRPNAVSLLTPQPEKDAKIAIVCAIVSPFASFLVCGIGTLILSGCAIGYGARASRYGSKLGKVAMVLGIVMLAFRVIGAPMLLNCAR